MLTQNYYYNNSRMGLPIYYLPGNYYSPPYTTDYPTYLPDEKKNITSYPQYPTPPLSEDYSQIDNQQRTSVIMKVEDEKIFEIKTNEISPLNDKIICKWKNCYSDFSTLENLALHVTQAHAITGAGGLYYCQWENCPRSERGFNARYKMLVHVRTHTKEKPHLCNVEGCNKSFSRAENLKIHTRSHSGEKPYKCPIEGCIKAYSNSSDRFKHTRTHSTDKPYFCKIQGCQKRYTDPSSLRKHIKTFKHENLSIEQIEVIEEPQQINNKNDFYPKIEITKKCTCSHDCLEHIQKTEILKYEAMFNLQKSEKTLWLNDGVKVEQMEWIDLPLDLSIHRSGY